MEETNNVYTKVYLLRGATTNNSQKITIAAAILVGLYLITR